MPINRDLFSPSLRPFQFDEVMDKKSLRAIDILADGVLFIEDIEGNLASYPYTSVTVPQRLILQIRKVIGDGSGGIGNGTTGTNIPLASLRGLH